MVFLKVMVLTISVAALLSTFLNSPNGNGKGTCKASTVTKATQVPNIDNGGTTQLPNNRRMQPRTANSASNMQLWAWIPPPGYVQPRPLFPKIGHQHNIPPRFALQKMGPNYVQPRLPLPKIGLRRMQPRSPQPQIAYAYVPEPNLQPTYEYRVARPWTNRPWTSRPWTNRPWTNRPFQPKIPFQPKKRVLQLHVQSQEPSDDEDHEDQSLWTWAVSNLKTLNALAKLKEFLYG